MKKECFCKGEHGGLIAGLYLGKPICQRHASFLRPGEVQPLPDDTDKVAGKIQVLRNIVPSGEYEQAQSLLDAGKLEGAVKTAYRAAAEALIGVIRGRVWNRVRKARLEDTSVAEETERLFYEVRGLQQRVQRDPKVAYEEVFDYLEDLPLRFFEVVPARVLLEEARGLLGDVAEIPFKDLPREVEELIAVIQRLIQNPHSSFDADGLRLRYDELLYRSSNVRNALAISATKGEIQERERERSGPKRGKKGRKTERRRYDRDWKSRLPRIDEDELPENVRLLRVS